MHKKLIKSNLPTFVRIAIVTMTYRLMAEIRNNNHRLDAAKTRP